MKAFSLIELMVVIAIIAVLAAVAVPAYKSYIKKTEVVEILAIMSGFENQIVQEYAQTGSVPSYINFGTIDGVLYEWVVGIGAPLAPGSPGAIRGWMDASRKLGYGGGHAQLHLFFNDADGVIKWTCVTQSYAVDADFLPGNCASYF